MALTKILVENNKYISEIVKRVRTEEEQNILRENIFNTIKVKEEDKIKILNSLEFLKDVENFKDFVDIYNKKIYNNIKDYLEGFISIIPSTGSVGKGELLCAFLNEKIIINGKTIDLILNNHKVEVKEVRYEKGILHNFRFGAENKIISNKIVSMVKKYIRQHLFLIPKEHWVKDAKEKLAKGELNALITLVRNFEDKIESIPDVDIIVNAKGDAYYEEMYFGNIYDKEFKNIMENLLKKEEKITYNKILEKIEELFSKTNRSYIFLIGQDKDNEFFGKMCFREKLEGMTLSAITQNNLKIGVKCDEIE